MSIKPYNCSMISSKASEFPYTSQKRQKRVSYMFLIEVDEVVLVWQRENLAVNFDYLVLDFFLSLNLAR